MGLLPTMYGALGGYRPLIEVKGRGLAKPRRSPFNDSNIDGIGEGYGASHDRPRSSAQAIVFMIILQPLEVYLRADGP